MTTTFLGAIPPRVIHPPTSRATLPRSWSDLSGLLSAQAEAHPVEVHHGPRRNSDRRERWRARFLVVYAHVSPSVSLLLPSTFRVAPRVCARASRRAIQLARVCLIRLDWSSPRENLLHVVARRRVGRGDVLGRWEARRETRERSARLAFGRCGAWPNGRNSWKR